MSVKTAGGSLTSRPVELARAGVNDIFAGLVASVITIAYGFFFAALIFAPPLNTWLAYGIAATCITDAVTAAIVAARSSLPFARLYEQVKALFAKSTETSFLLFDFRLVTGIDSSAMHSFTQIKRAADELGARLVLVTLSPELNEAFRNRKLIPDDVILADARALEACEKEVIAAHLAEGATAQTLHNCLAQAHGSDDYATQLVELCERLEVGKDALIATQVEPASSMHFILEGRIGITVEMDDGRLIRVRSLGPHTTIGEIGMITRQKRSATIKAELPSVLYGLSADAYERFSERTARSPSPHLYREGHGRASLLRQQGDRRAAPLKSRHAATAFALASDRRNDCSSRPALFQIFAISSKA
jgi:CRP-like cAMP-binding protein/anti-anti-sigma regulatory factor